MTGKLLTLPLTGWAKWLYMLSVSALVSGVLFKDVQAENNVTPPKQEHLVVSISTGIPALTTEQKAQLDAILEQTVAWYSDQQAPFKQELTAIALGNLLDATRIEADKDFSKTRNSLKRANNAVAHFRSISFYKQMEANIINSSLDETVKVNALRNFQELKKSGLKLEKTWWDWEERVIALKFQMIDFLQKHQNNWKIIDNPKNSTKDIKFGASVDTSAFRQYLNETRKIQQQQHLMLKNENEEILDFFK